MRGVLQRPVPALHHAVHPYQCGAVAETFAAKAGVLPSVVFFAIIVIYLLSPLLQVKQVSGKMLLILMLVIGLLANPNMVSVKAGGVEWLPLNLYINGDTFYYVLYGVLGRAIGMMDTDKSGSRCCAPRFSLPQCGLFPAGHCTS